MWILWELFENMFPYRNKRFLIAKSIRINENQGKQKWAAKNKTKNQQDLSNVNQAYKFQAILLESDHRAIKSKQTPNKPNQIWRLKSTLGGSWSQTARICIKFYEDCMRILWEKYTAFFPKAHLADPSVKNFIILYEIQALSQKSIT